MVDATRKRTLNRKFHLKLLSYSISIQRQISVRRPALFEERSQVPCSFVRRAFHSNKKIMLLGIILLAVLATPKTASFDIQTFTADRDLSKSVFDFGLRLQNEMIEENSYENVVISPTSIYGVLGLTLLGSVGRTNDELSQALGFLSDIVRNRARHRVLGDHLRHLTDGDGSSRTLHANGVFVDEGTRLRQIYAAFLRDVYNASVAGVNFTDGVRAMQTINEWVSQHTEGKISNLLEEPPSSLTRVVLASALYFQGQWRKPFFPMYTQKMNFSRDVSDPSKNIEVDMMMNDGHFRYYVNLQYDCELLALPYNDTKNTMYVLKPLKPQRTSLDSILKNMTSDLIEQMIERSEMKHVVVRFPKMKVSSRTNLKEALSSLGLRSMFTPGDANFALMVEGQSSEDENARTEMDKVELRQRLSALPNPGIHVDVLLHKAAVSVDEFGTEAVAATAGLMARTAVMFYCFSPFYLFIKNEPTNLVMFSAVINDPSKY